MQIKSIFRTQTEVYSG